MDLLQITREYIYLSDKTTWTRCFWRSLSRYNKKHSLAVKTLPSLAISQAEVDFMMEVLIDLNLINYATPSYILPAGDREIIITGSETESISVHLNS
ncbi:ALK tyrosine kinase receptor isoform X1 [Vespula squamosa]|uniref:ALK tyrosine kinase receptor isoform X1 n=1 Tax=Vespula squamosa TaxID=30214 RepID=A0ABD2C2N9_VESSQ